MQVPDWKEVPEASGAKIDSWIFVILAFGSQGVVLCGWWECLGGACEGCGDVGAEAAFFVALIQELGHGKREEPQILRRCILETK